MDPLSRQLRLGRCWFVEVGRTDRVIVSSLDACLASAAALAGTKADARCPFSISLAFVAFVVFFISAP